MEKLADLRLELQLLVSVIRQQLGCSEGKGPVQNSGVNECVALVTKVHMDTSSLSLNTPMVSSL